MKCKSVACKDVLKLVIVLACLCGFLYQTAEFMMLYWSYPTIVDIQESIVSEAEVPGISFCNNVALNPGVLCKLKSFCFQSYLLRFLQVCALFPDVCAFTQTFARDLTIVTYQTFMKSHDLNVTVMNEIKKSVDTFLKCRIIKGRKEIDCGVDVLVGSYYSDSTMFNLCYTVNSLWGNPKKEIVKLGKYDKIVLDFFVDVTGRERLNSSDETFRKAKYNFPSSSSTILLTVHSPYISESPFVSGLGFLGGKHYKIKLKMENKHLLPPPYQTNCTDYMSNWKARGGYGPINQLMAVEECKLNQTFEIYGCIPFSVDYPHNETICRYCNNCTELATIAENCSSLLNTYNQPCDYATYEMHVEEQDVLVKKVLLNNQTGENETLVFPRKGQNCTFEHAWTQKCQEIKIEIVFDDFLVTNLTYNPKIEDLELFSVIGGYMGMYLGVSFVTVYDAGEWLLLKLGGMGKKKEKTKRRTRKNKIFVAREPSSAFRRRRHFNPEFMETHW